MRSREGGKTGDRDPPEALLSLASRPDTARAHPARVRYIPRVMRRARIVECLARASGRVRPLRKLLLLWNTTEQTDARRSERSVRTPSPQLYVAGTRLRVRNPS